MSQTRAPIGVGVIGASPRNPGWAMAAHIPALRALPGFALRAVATSSPASAAAATEALGVSAYDNAQALIDQADVDLVVVAVKVADHYALTKAALAAGKMVLTEWPLGVDLAQAEAIAALAQAAGVRTFVGLQARFAPQVRYARDLIASGALGRVLSTSLVGSGMIWGDAIPPNFAYTLDHRAGAGVGPVALLHALEALTFTLGDFRTIDATSAIGRPRVRVGDTEETVEASSPDHIAVSGILADGAVASVLYRGGAVRGPNLRWEINGTQGDLAITAEFGNFQVADLKIEGAWGETPRMSELALPAAYRDGEAGAAEGFGANTLRAYAAIAHDLTTGEVTVPDFAYAVRRHQLLAAIERAARDGVRQEIA